MAIVSSALNHTKRDLAATLHSKLLVGTTRPIAPRVEDASQRWRIEVRMSARGFSMNDSEHSGSGLSRRSVLLGFAGAAAALFGTSPAQAMPWGLYPEDFDPKVIYQAIDDGGILIPPLRLKSFNRRVFRSLVRLDRRERPGTIVVRTRERAAYLLMDNDYAIRYGVAVGKAGLDFKGQAVIGAMQAWPRWIPTKDMIERDPKKYARYADGVDGGPTNPLGARALYLHVNGRDTYYRLHGTTDPRSIGRSASNGCIRFFNHDIIDLYERVGIGTKVVVE